VLEEVPAGIIVVRHLQDGRDPLEYADPFVPSTAADSAAADLGTPVIQISDRGEHEDNHRTLRDTHGTAASQGAVARTSATKVTTANTSVVSTPATIATTTDTTVTTSTGTVVTTVTTIATLTSTRVTTTATTVATTVTTVTTSATTVATSITTAATTTDPAVTIELKPSHAEASKSNSSLSPTEHSMCSHFYDDCRDSQCCLDPHSSCFEKDEGYAACRPSCEPGVHPEEAPEKQTPWTCTLLSRGGVPAPADTTTAAAAAAARRSAELYCFVLVMAGSYEVALMENAVAKGTSVFQCDGYDVFSGEPLQLGEDVGSGRQVVATTVDGSLKVEKGGVYNTALNSAVFARLWGQVLAGGQAPKHDFTIKVDADAVFFAERVRRHLEGRSAEDSMYLNNCKDGLHGPLEIVSRKGMQDLGDGLDGCVESLKFEWDTYGEDVFLRHCLGLVGVSRVDDFGLLDETFDGTPPACSSGAASFHPLKSLAAYNDCLARASSSAADALRLPEAVHVTYDEMAGACRTEDGGPGRYSKIERMDQDGCQSTCTADPTCVAYEHNEEWCELHTEAISHAEPTSGTSCYLKRPQALGCFEYGTNYYGNDCSCLDGGMQYRDGISSPVDCQALCRSVGAPYFTLTAGGWCWCKTSDADRRTGPGEVDSVSGPSSCPASSAGDMNMLMH